MKKTAEKTKTYYKVVRKEDGLLWSIFTSGFAKMEYRLPDRGMRTKTLPLPGTGILAFATKAAARSFIKRESLSGKSPYHQVSILRGKGQERRLGQYGSLPFKSSKDATLIIRNYWKKENKCSWPDGTVALKWFEPEKIV